MPQLDIVCATWNTENKSPDNQAIINFYKALWKQRNLNAPDFVVIGLQETVPDEQTKEWVADLCLRTGGWSDIKQPDMKSSNKPPDMKPIMDGGKAVKGPSIMGKTKPLEPFCYQHIGIMQRTDSPWQVLQVKEDRYLRGLTSEKGALALVVDISSSSSPTSTSSTSSTSSASSSASSSSSSSSLSSSSSHKCIRLVFVSTHVSPKGQEKELTEYFTWANGLAREGSITTSDGDVFEAKNVANIRFIMGDLNFRLFPNQNAPQDEGLPGRDDTSDTWADALLSPPKRDLLFKHYDALENAAHRNYPNLLPNKWSFPRPNTNDGAHICFPTYKRQKGKQAEGYVKIINEGSGDKAEAIKQLYNLTNKKFFDDDREAWNIGWLDRIGYISDAGQNVLKFNSVASCWAWFDVVASDHTPVFLRLSTEVVY
jgi:hypothetical protein